MVKTVSMRIDSLEVDIPCPECGAQNRVSLGQIEREEIIQCLNCGTKIKLKDKDGSVRRGTRDIQRALDDLDRTLRRLGRRR